MIDFRFPGHHRNSGRRDSGIENSPPRSPKDVEIQVTPFPTPKHNEPDGSSREETLTSGSGSYVTESEEDPEESNRKTHLPKDHPARKLPPIDLMFLVDTSSSIGINNFDIVSV